MVRATLFSILFLFIFICSSCDEQSNNKNGTQRILPRLILEKNDIYRVNMELIQAVTTMENGSEEVVDQSIDIDFQVKVKEVSEESFYTLVAEIKKVTLTRNIPLKETVEIRSTNLKSPDLDTNYVKMVRSLMNKSIILEVDDRGIIKNRKIVEQKNIDSTIASDRFLPRIFGEQLSTRQSFELFFPYYPPDSIAIGQTWDTEVLLEGSVSLLAKGNLRIDSLQADTLSLSVNTQLMQQKSSKVTNEDAQKSISGDQVKSLFIDRNTGWPISVEITSELKVMDKIGLKIIKTTATTINFTSEKAN